MRPSGTLTIPQVPERRPRTVELDVQARRALGGWMLEPNRIGFDHDALWLNQRRQPLQPSGMEMAVRRGADRAGVEFAAHDVRRALVVEWLRTGGNEASLMALAGWSDVSMVRRYVRERRGELALAEARRPLVG